MTKTAFNTIILFIFMINTIRTIEVLKKGIKNDKLLNALKKVIMVMPFIAFITYYFYYKDLKSALIWGVAIVLRLWFVFRKKQSKKQTM